MEIQRTANAGVLLKMDGVSILLDGLCDRVGEYLPTTKDLAEQLLDNPPDILAFTHYHADHCSEALLLPYRKQNLRPILGPESLPLGTVKIGEVTIMPVESRHLGKTEPNLQHVSYIVQGTKCVWFVGDAAPLQWKTRIDLPKPDVLIAPYAYGNTESAWRLACSLAPQVVLVHLPPREADSYGLWDAVDKTVKNSEGAVFWTPQMGETISL